MKYKNRTEGKLKDQFNKPPSIKILYDRTDALAAIQNLYL
jgi:hypothetical protein